jgi:signal transduction histidine kinase
MGKGDSTLRRWAVALFTVAVAVAVVNPVLGQGLAGSPALVNATHLVDYSDAVFSALMATAGLLILWFRPRHGVGWVLLVIAVAEVSCTFGQTYGARAVARPEESLPLGLWAMSLSAPLWVIAVFLPVTSLLLRYPSGRIEGSRVRRLERVVWGAMAALWVGYATNDSSVTDEIKDRLPPVRLPELVSGVLFGGGMLVVAGCALFCVAHTIRRTWRAGYPERQQLAWLLTIAPVAVGVLFTPWEGMQAVFDGIPIAIAVGVFRYRLLGIEVVVRRTLLYGLLTGLVLLVFVVVTAGLSSVLPSGGTAEVIAAGLVAVGVVPLRDRLQRGVDRFVYGDRSDPLAALRRLSNPLGASSADALLPEVLGGVASSLRLPGAEIIGRAGTRAVVGTVLDTTEDVPLVMGGEGIGVLRLVPRPGESHLPPADRRLVESLAPLVAAVLHSVELAAALQVEQERVVAATTTERARLRQELHDGLGPSLTGIGLGLEALESRVGASDLVDRLRAETASSLDEVRRIIDGLRPGALETADLLALLRVRAEHLSSTTPVQVSVVAPARLPALPDQVETAALRVVEEALTNVVRHADATHCTVVVTLDDALRIEVRDDGRGYDGPRSGGVGVGSMVARAEALGGTCSVSGGVGGTLVSLTIPLAPQVMSEAVG